MGMSTYKTNKNLYTIVAVASVLVITSLIAGFGYYKCNKYVTEQTKAIKGLTSSSAENFEKVYGIKIDADTVGKQSLAYVSGGNDKGKLAIKINADIDDDNLAKKLKYFKDNEFSSLKEEEK